MRRATRLASSCVMAVSKGTWRSRWLSRRKQRLAKAKGARRRFRVGRRCPAPSPGHPLREGDSVAAWQVVAVLQNGEALHGSEEPGGRGLYRGVEAKPGMMAAAGELLMAIERA